MADDILPLKKQFKLAAKSLCQPCATISVNSGNTKSYAQVATLVLPPKSCGLKPGYTKQRRTTPLAVRVTEQQKMIIQAKAKAAGYNVNQYIRLAVLGSHHVPSVDPVKRQTLLDAYRELNRQGNNLNQIARHLNANIVAPEQADSLLAMLARSLLAAHQAVREALAEGRSAS